MKSSDEPEPEFLRVTTLFPRPKESGSCLGGLCDETEKRGRSSASP
jgi:hypothetical protein